MWNARKLPAGYAGCELTGTSPAVAMAALGFERLVHAFEAEKNDTDDGEAFALVVVLAHLASRSGIDSYALRLVAVDAADLVGEMLRRAKR